MRKLVLGVATLLLPIGLLATVGASGATAHANSGVTGTGNFSCTKITGTITFTPPLSNTAQTVKSVIVSKATGCTGGTPAVVSSTSKSTTTTPNDSCSSLAGPSPANFTTTYVVNPSLPKANPSAFSGTATPFVNGTQTGFDLAGTVTGSYPSATNSTTAHAVLKQTVTQLGTLCGSTGISKLNISSGTLTNG